MRNYTNERKVRRASILDAAVTVARKPGGWSTLTRSAIALQAECAEGTVNLYFRTMAGMKAAVMKEAIQRSIWEIIGQGVACGYPSCAKLSPEVRSTAMQYIIH